ncbi:flagellar hook-basal body complex protein FliE [Paenibacillus sp. XY044]|uniref:flagellar hook-basal body complex protein FliE n=1 Tax=Paenibacillus sp. XY044 TaxID=2026089 RepID=UPI000B98E437|nr:flagellar hook-basal body complex protein FliE [Paenibacillus sp. XY044]OZB97795.1 flagellar hook-basal body complex protein FliE [Paenibacillus sp. XY044]
MIQNSMFSTQTIQPLEMKQSASSASKTPAQSLSDFGSYLDNALNQVAGQEKAAEEMSNQYMLGQVDVDQVMISSQKALLSLELTTQIRNKAIEAYQEIMRTQI